MPPLLVKLVLGRVPVLGKTAQRRFQSMIDVHLDYVEAELASRPWFAGDAMTAADIMMIFTLEAARHRHGLDARRPAPLGWPEAIHARPPTTARRTAGGRK